MRKNNESVKFKEIIFLSEHEADEVFDIMDSKGEEAALAYLTQWDNGDVGEIVESLDIGRKDYTFGNENYIMGYNTRLEYIYLYAKV